jgi:hypothetical protein
MLRPDHEALLQGAVDGTLTPEERDALRQLLAHDADARERVGELGRLNALLAALGPAEAPADLVDHVLARVSPNAAAKQPVRPFVRPIPKREGVLVNKKLIFGLAAAAAVILAVITYTSYPPATEGTEATIGAAQRAQTPQIASKDVGLGDTSAQDVLQSDTWDAIMKDEDLRSSLQDADVRRMLEDADLRQALENGDVRHALRQPQFARIYKFHLSDQAAAAAEARRSNDARIQRAFENEGFARALARMDKKVAARLLDVRIARGLSSDAMARVVRDARFERALRAPRFAENLARGRQQ